MKYLLLVFASFLNACRSYHVDPTKNYKAPFDKKAKRFENTIGSPKNLLDVIKWKMTAEKKEWPHDLSNTPHLLPRERLSEDELSITFINHATVLIQYGPLNILTDPIFSERSSPFSWIGPKRVRPPGLSLSDLPEIDIVLIGHNHYDHLDLPTLKMITGREKQKKAPHFFVGIGNAKLLTEEGFSNVSEMDWDDQWPINNLSIIFTEAQHWSARGIFDRQKTLWGSFIVRGHLGQVYFASDTGYSDHFKRTAQKYGPIKVALLPIGAYEPRWFMKHSHMNPEDAVMAYKDLDAEFALPIHHKTFQLTDEAYDQPMIDLKKSLANENISENLFRELDFGESWSFEKKK
jgi:L-ascorbate metabolism protein UlaG (beta-lactamase superfamily)